jgi:hypothetical protein
MFTYMAGTTMATAGIPVLGAVDAATDLGSIEPMTASGATVQGSMVGLLVDATGTVAATGITDESVLFSKVIVNPDMIYGARANNGTTSGTALATTSPTAADGTGATLTGTTTFDNGWVFCKTGANAGSFRRCDNTSGSLSINLVNGTATTDVYVAVHGFPCSVQADDFECYDLTTDLTEVVAQTAVVDTNNFATLDISTKVHDPENLTEYKLIANNSLFGGCNNLGILDV